VSDTHAQRVAQAARRARAEIELLLDVLGWPASERALSLAIDRLKQLEEGGQ